MNNLSNPQLEAQVIGAIIRAGERDNREIVFEADAILRGVDAFTNSDTSVRRATYEAILDIARGGAAPNRVLIIDRLRAAGVGGVEFVAEACDTSALTSKDAFLMAVDSLAELHRKRTVRNILRGQLSDIESGEDSRTVARGAAMDLLRAVERREATGGTIGTILSRWEEDERRRVTDPGSFWSMRWGIYDIDFFLGEQARGGQLVTVGAHTGAGKSVTACDLTRANGLHGSLNPTIISGEMKEADLLDRIISAEGSIPYEQVRDKRVAPEYMDAFQRTREFIRDTAPANAWIEHMPWAHLRDVEAKIRMLTESYGTRLVIVDYIQLIESARNHNREREVTEVARTLKKLASELDIVVVGLYQLNDEILGRSGHGRRPRSTDARESKNIAKDSDISCVIDRPSVRKDETFHDNEPARYVDHDRRVWEFARIDFDKVRRGRNGHKLVLWQGEFQRFAEVPPDLTVPEPVNPMEAHDVW